MQVWQSMISPKFQKNPDGQTPLPPQTMHGVRMTPHALHRTSFRDHNIHQGLFPRSGIAAWHFGQLTCVAFMPASDRVLRLLENAHESDHDPDNAQDDRDQRAQGGQEELLFEPALPPWPSQLGNRQVPLDG